MVATARSRRPARKAQKKGSAAAPKARAKVFSRADKARARWFLDRISARFPDAKIELNHRAGDPWQLLVAVVLSAQCTDKKVNEATPALFAAFPDVRAFAQATPEEIEPHIRTLGLFRGKARNLVATARILLDDHEGRVPEERAVLETLPGVGKKSAAVIIANAFGKPACAVDTHVGRVSRRMGITDEKSPDKVEEDLTALLPRHRLLEAHHAFIWHGRRICHARRPTCEACPVSVRCPRIGV